MKVKKVLPFVLSLCMLGGTFAGLAGCNKGNGNGDGGDNPPPPGHTHSYTNWHDNGDGTHSPECSGKSDPECDAPVKTSEKENHVYDNDSDTDCNKCGYTRVIQGGEHTHTYSQHKVTCDTCDEPNPVATTFKGWDGTDNGFTDDGVSKIYVVGDSTVCDYNLSPQKFDADRFLPRYGYGTQLHEYLNYSAENVVNLAISGRSAVSLMGEPNYQTLVNSIGEGDYLIIGFGHNDEKLELNRFGDPLGNINEPVTDRGDSWKYILNENYIKLAKHRGATPIICTPIVRYNANGAYAGNTIHVTDYGDYPAALKELGEETGTTVVDLTTLTKNLWETAGKEAAYFHSVSKYTGAIVQAPYDASVLPDFETIDGTHINKFGAKTVAYQLANALKTTSVSSIVKNGISAPVKADEYVGAINQNYVKTGYAGFDPSNNVDNNVTGDWYKTAFGDLGGSFSSSNLTATYASDKFTVSYAGKGKIASGGDGLAAIFRQIGKDDNFTITAHAKVTAFDTGVSVNQAAFGIMLRDDIFMNQSVAALKSEYVTAGALTRKDKTDHANFTRVGSNSPAGVDLTFEIANGTEVDLEMTKTGNTVTVKFGTVVSTFENVALTSVDSEYMYLCLFANRGLTVEYTNVNFTKK